jgi:hypothetical protein
MRKPGSPNLDAEPVDEQLTEPVESGHEGDSCYRGSSLPRFIDETGVLKAHQGEAR